MEGNKLTKTSKIVLAIGFTIAIIGIFIIPGNPDVGAWVCGIGLGPTMLYLIIIAIKSLLKESKLGVFLIAFFTLLAITVAAVLIGEAMGLGFGGSMVIMIILGVIAFIIYAKIESTACPKCGKRLAMKEISRKTVSSYATTVDVDREVKNSKGEVIRRYKEAVPATRYIYDCVDECKYCGNSREVRREATYRD